MNEWPTCWLYALRGEVAIAGDKAAGTRYECGSHVSVDRHGVLTYRCDCGGAFSRAPGTQNEAARDWVAIHRHHLKEKK